MSRRRVELSSAARGGGGGIGKKRGTRGFSRTRTFGILARRTKNPIYLNTAGNFGAVPIPFTAGVRLFEVNTKWNREEEGRKTRRRVQRDFSTTSRLIGVASPDRISWIRANFNLRPPPFLRDADGRATFEESESSWFQFDRREGGEKRKKERERTKIERLIAPIIRRPSIPLSPFIAIGSRGNVIKVESTLERWYVKRKKKNRKKRKTYFFAHYTRSTK